MNEEHQDFAAKLQQIEEQAALTLHEYPHGLTVERQRLILGLARQLRSHLQDELRQAAAAGDTEAQHLRPITKQ